MGRGLSAWVGCGPGLHLLCVEGAGDQVCTDLVVDEVVHTPDQQDDESEHCNGTTPHGFLHSERFGYLARRVFSIRVRVLYILAHYSKKVNSL